jgi:hypothetical protein
MRKKNIHAHGKSLKTLLLYTGLVFLVIIVSLLVKVFFLVRESKYDGAHHFTISFIQDKKVKEILVVNPDVDSLAVLFPQNTVPQGKIGKNLLILPDASVILPNSISAGPDASHLLSSLLWQYPLIKTDLTLPDLIRLYSFAKRVPPENTAVQTISNQTDQNNGTNILTDNAIEQENVTIQIINATDVPGLGTHLAQMLTLMGANIVAVTTALATQQNSSIIYYGERTYTLDKLSDLLLFPVAKANTQPIANLVITLGESSRNLLQF